MPSLSRGRVIAIWMSIVATTMMVAVLAGVHATPSTWGFALLVGLAPAAILMIVWRLPQPTVAEVLYAVRQDRTR